MGWIEWQEYRYKSNKIERLRVLDTVNKLSTQIKKFVQYNYPSISANNCYQKFLIEVIEKSKNYDDSYYPELKTPYGLQTVQDLKEGVKASLLKQLDAIHNNKTQTKINFL